MNGRTGRRRLAGLLIVWSCALLGCGAATAPTGAECGKFILPDMRLLTLDDMGADDREAFLKRASGSAPGCLSVDLNADGIKDAAVIAQDRKTETTFLVIALGKSNGDFAILVREPLGKSLQGLFLVPFAGHNVTTSEALGGPEPRHELTGDGVQVVFVEKAATVYYWDRAVGKIGVVQTSD